jgi:hypothetical protein
MATSVRVVVSSSDCRRARSEDVDVFVRFSTAAGEGPALRRREVARIQRISRNTNLAKQ